MKIFRFRKISKNAPLWQTDRRGRKIHYMKALSEGFLMIYNARVSEKTENFPSRGFTLAIPE